ncbi:HAD-IC family P-type ATPase, partial [candidate division WOR-3 bacterium]|nr:HAD-IC family P-type ATPase [candidate division WOR-3 bacterium]
MDWHCKSIEDIFQTLSSSKQGLSIEEAKKRILSYGPNKIKEVKKRTVLGMILDQFKDFMILVLIAAALVSGVIGEPKDTIAILVIVILNAIIGFVQEYRAEKAIEALKMMAAQVATVIRDGEPTSIPASNIVPGDLVLLEAGNIAPADIRLIEVAYLKIDESSLTGESVPVEKHTNPLQDKSIPLGDRKNMAYKGTIVSYGRANGVVVSTGMDTEFGKIAKMLQEQVEVKTPLQKRLAKFGQKLAIAVLAICAIVFGVGFIRGEPPLLMFLTAISLAVAAIPEALPAVVTISLAIGAKKLVKQNTLIKKLPAVETLGSVTYICSDKTGTLTQDEMTVRQIYTNVNLIDVTGVGYEPKGEFLLNGMSYDPGEDAHLQALLNTCSLCNDTHLALVEGTWQIKGDPTEGALAVVAAKANIWQHESNSQFPRIGEVPFSSERKKMTTIHQTLEDKVAYSKGAPEVILNSCSHIYKDGQEKEVTDEDKRAALNIAQTMAGDALRVLGMAYKRFPEEIESSETAEQDMVFVGLAGMIDPPREEVKEAIKLCEQAGIKSVMITGDHKLTAVAIAKELGLLKEGVALTGAEIDNLSDDEFEVLVEKIEVYARVSPAHKLRVVEALTKKGHVVAMTGDGVNDAPALKKADIGVAMGITGTDV